MCTFPVVHANLVLFASFLREALLQEYVNTSSAKQEGSTHMYYFSIKQLLQKFKVEC